MVDTKQKSYDVVRFIQKYFVPTEDEKLWGLITNANIRNLKQLASFIKSYKKDEYGDDEDFDMILGCTSYGICLEYLGYKFDKTTRNYLRERGGNWNWDVKPAVSIRKVFESLKQYEKNGIIPKKVEYKSDSGPVVNLHECILCHKLNKIPVCDCKPNFVTPIIAGSSWSKPLNFK